MSDFDAHSNHLEEKEVAMNLYHVIVNGCEALERDILYPLNRLPRMGSNLYDINVAKYNSCREVLERDIPHLNCKWGDVVFLTATHPQKLFQTLASESVMQVSVRTFYTIPTDVLNPALLAVWPFQKRENDSQPEYDPQTVYLYDEARARAFVEIPSAACEYFRGFRGMKGVKRISWFRYVPTFFYKDQIVVSKLKKEQTNVCKPS